MDCDKLAVYSPEDVKVLIGVGAVDGFALNSIVSVAKVNSTYVSKINSDGSVSRTHKGDNVYNVAISLSNASEWNQVFTYMMLVDRATQMGKFPVLIKDDQGTSLLVSPTSWIEKLPDSSFTTEVDTRDWLICCSHAIFNVGGNYEVGGMAMDVVNTLAGGAGLLGQVL